MVVDCAARGVKFGRLLIYVPLTLVAVAALLPVYWLLTGAVKPPESLLKMPPDMVPRAVTTEHLHRLFDMTPAGRWLWNSLVLALLTVISNVVFCSMAGYGFAKHRFPGNKTLFWLCLCTMMVPAQVTIIPLFIGVRELGLMNSYLGILLPSLVTAFGVFLMRQFMQGIPNSLIEAARIDGCHEFTIFWKIVFPLCKPVVAVLAILSFSASWNNFLWPLVVAVDTQMWTMPVGLASVNDSFFRDYGLSMAGAAVAAVPMIILFFALQRYFLKGMLVGAVKG